MAKLSGESPALRLKSGVENPPFWIQEGEVFPEGEGEDPVPLEDLPEWFWEEVKKQSPVRLKEAYKFTIPEFILNPPEPKKKKEEEKETSKTAG